MQKKIYPRVAFNSSAIVANEDGVKLKVVSVDSCGDDLNIQCSTSERNRITPDGLYLRNGRPMELAIWLDLPSTEEESSIEARCQITFSRRIANDICQIGLRFKEIAEEDHARLKRFLDYSLAVNAT